VNWKNTQLIDLDEKDSIPFFVKLMNKYGYNSQYRNQIYIIWLIIFFFCGSIVNWILLYYQNVDTQNNIQNARTTNNTALLELSKKIDDNWQSLIKEVQRKLDLFGNSFIINDFEKNEDE